MCHQHNKVNKLLGKNSFECTIDKLNKRWMTGCQEQDKGF